MLFRLCVGLVRSHRSHTYIVRLAAVVALRLKLMAGTAVAMGGWFESAPLGRWLEVSAIVAQLQ